jgi:hypothetical protein
MWKMILIFLKIKIIMDLHHLFFMVVDYDTCHNVNMPCGIIWNFGQNELKSIYE